MSHLLIFTTILSFFLTGCTIYRSQGRVQFEDIAPSRISLLSVMTLKQCTPFDSTNNSYELIFAEADLAVFRNRETPNVEVKALQKDDITTKACDYEFTDEQSWNLFKEQFITELKENIVIQ